MSEIQTLLMVLILPFTMHVLNTTLMLKPTKHSLIKLTPFECGCIPFLLNYTHISLKYYKTALLFLLFDIEFALILPSTVILSTLQTLNTVAQLFIILNFLTLTLYYELAWGVLNWTN